MANGNVLGVIAIKGGVGKTTLVANLGATLANKFDKKVLLVDANFSTPHLGLSLGLANPQISIHDVLNHESTIFKALYKHPAGFHIIPGALTGKKIDPLGLKQSLAPLKPYYDLIILDSSPALNDEMFAAISASDKLLVVTSPDHPTLSSTLHAVKIAKQKKTPVIGLVINKSRNKGFEISKEEIENLAGLPVLSILPDDISVLKALSFSAPVTLYSPYKKVSREYSKLASALIGETPKSFFNSINNFLTEMFTFGKNKQN
ncbi:AAA family ATPase [Candidatus Pacearchaeota archaeon]|nr:AAA family ATPase [Candidatus Pacearchaeota archaeon]